MNNKYDDIIMVDVSGREFSINPLDDYYSTYILKASDLNNSNIDSFTVSVKEEIDNQTERYTKLIDDILFINEYVEKNMSNNTSKIDVLEYPESNIIDVIYEI